MFRAPHLSPSKDRANPTAWLSLFVAVAAIVLSQLPPIRSYFASATFQLSVGPTIYVEHTLGYIMLQPSIQLENDGDTQGKIDLLQASLRGVNGVELSLPGQLYIEPPNVVGIAETMVPMQFMGAFVPPGGKWEKHVRFFERLSDNDLLALERTKRTVGEEIMAATVSPITGLKEISDGSFDTIAEEVNRRLAPFVHGEFHLKFDAYDGAGDLVAQSCYRFSLGEEQKRALDKITAGYKVGQGLIFPPLTEVGVYANLHGEDCSVTAA